MINLGRVNIYEIIKYYLWIIYNGIYVNTPENSTDIYIFNFYKILHRTKDL